jgi:ribosomal protein S27E
MDEYIHVPRGGEISFMAVTLKVSAEGCLDCGNRQLLYVEGITTVGSVCCGAVECRVIYVPGFIVSRHCKRDETSGHPVSRVEPATDPATREEVKKLLFKTFPSSLFLLA